MENNVNEQKKVVDYWATNKPESTINYYAAQFQQIWNNNYRRFLESTRFFTGWMMNEESLNSLNEDIEKARQRQLQTEQRMAEYKATESGAKNLVLDVTGGLVQAFGDPINFVINKATPTGILFDIVENSFKEASALDPERLDLRFGIASSQILQNKTNEALNTYRDIIKIYPSSFEANMLLAG